VFKVIVTLGPAITHRAMLLKINRSGSCIYRINGSQIMTSSIPLFIAIVRKILPRAIFMIDLPGNKIRISNISQPIRLVRGEVFTIYDYQLNYPPFCQLVRPKDIIYANDSIFRLEVIEKKLDQIKILSKSDGLLYPNKGLHIRGIHRKLPFLFEKDKEIIRLAEENNIDYIGLSFVRNSSDLIQAKRLICSPEQKIIAKIETKSAFMNLSSILSHVSAILVDRGDLASDMDIINLESIQEYIIRQALMRGKQVYLATQLLKNMEHYPVPLIPEVIDLCRSIKYGISGIQLSEETAIGKYPIECVELVFKAYNRMCKQT
jgi:pyruvate kinase